MLRNLRCWDPSLVSKVRLRCIKPVMLKMFALALFPQKMHPTLSPLYPSKPFLVIPTSLAEDNFGEELFLLVIVASSWAYQSGWTGRLLCMNPQVPECLWLESVPLQSEQKIVGLCTSITHHWFEDFSATQTQTLLSSLRTTPNSWVPVCVSTDDSISLGKTFRLPKWTYCTNTDTIQFSFIAPKNNI